MQTSWSHRSKFLLVPNSPPPPLRLEHPITFNTISSEGISVDPTKVEEVMDWNSPTSVHQIRSFLGLAGYYHRFIPDFSRIAKPMMEL